MTGRRTTVGAEAHAYSAGTLTYSLDHTPVTNITEVTGTVGDSPYTFTWNVDYVQSGNAITFLGEATPDDGTDFSVSYTYGSHWILLGNQNTNIELPFVVIDPSEMEDAAYVNDATADNTLSFEITAYCKSPSQRNTIADALRDMFHNSMQSLSFWDVRLSSAMKDEFVKELSTIHAKQERKYINGYYYRGIFEFRYKVVR